MRKQSGFTLVELVIVIVILGLLAVNAIPKFLDLTDQAKRSSIEGVAGGYATAVSLIRSQWEAEARPSETFTDNSGTDPVTVTDYTVLYDGVQVYLTEEDFANNLRPGYVIGTERGGINATDCTEIWLNIFQQPPKLADTNTNLVTDPLSDFDYYTGAPTGSGSTTMCYYYQVVSLNKLNGVFQEPTIGENIGNYFTYEPANSQVVVTINQE